MSEIVVAAVEAGGTTFVVCTAEVSSNSKPRILHRREVDSSYLKPADTIKQCAEFLLEFKPKGGEFDSHRKGIKTSSGIHAKSVGGLNYTGLLTFVISPQ